MSSKVMKACLFAAAGAVALLAGAGAQANVASGSVYEVSQDVAGNATPANVPSGPAAVTFLAPTPLSFGSGDLYTIGEYLASGGATILTGSGNLGDTLDGTLFDFQGFVTVTDGQTFTAGHDDGLRLSSAASP